MLTIRSDPVGTDVLELRAHRISGLLTGTLPLAPQQNVFYGLPLQLCAEEVAYLLEQGNVPPPPPLLLFRLGLGLTRALAGLATIDGESESEGGPAVDAARMAVFRDLHARGFFLAPGLRFGADFTVYPGDPLRFHAHYSAAIHTPRTHMHARDLVAAGRLGTGVKKTHLICFIPDEPEPDQDPKPEVEYYSLTWAGFGT